MNQQRDIKHQEEVIEKLKSFNREKVHQTGGKPGENAGQDRGHRKALRGPHGYEADADAPDLKRK